MKCKGVWLWAYPYFFRGGVYVGRAICLLFTVNSKLIYFKKEMAGAPEMG